MLPYAHIFEFACIHDIKIAEWCCAYS